VSHQNKPSHNDLDLMKIRGTKKSTGMFSMRVVAIVAPPERVETKAKEP